MSDEQKPNLNLGTPPGSLATRGGTMQIWLPLVAILQVVVVLCVGLLLLRPGDSPAVSDTSAVVLDDLQSIALELENKSLPAKAAQAWTSYLEAAGDFDERAEMLYRVGQLYMKAEQFDDAIVAFVRCEQAGLDSEKLKSNLGQHVITCLNRLGMYGEVGRELSRRAEVGGEDVEKGQVLAKLAGDELTDADLDRMIERRVDQEMSLGVSGADQQRREQIVKFYNQPQMRQQLLQDMLRLQLFARRSRELKLDEGEGFRSNRQTLEEGLLANELQKREFEKIQPTNVDIDAFYKANVLQYRQPASIRVLYDELEEGEDPAKILEGIESADDLRKLLKSRIPDGGELTPFTIVRGPSHPQLGDTEPLFTLDKGKWTTKAHVNADLRFLVLIEDETAERTPPLSDIESRVEADYRARKKQELVQSLFEDLMSRYNVKIIPPSTNPKKETDGGGEK